MSERRRSDYYVQSAQVRGEPRYYWIERRSDRQASGSIYQSCVEDFGTNKKQAERRCAELNSMAAVNK